MKFTQTATIAAPRPRVWSFVSDLPKVATCVPGIEAVEAKGQDKCSGVLKISVGPIRLTLAGDVSVTERDELGGVIRLHVAAADRGAGGAVDADVKITVSDAAGATRLTVDTDSRIMGRVADFGQPIIKRKADQILGEFANRLGRAVAAEKI